MRLLIVHLFLSLGLFFSSQGQTSNNVQLLFHWDDENLVGSAAYNNTYNEIWGYAQNGREYAIIGSTAGTHIFDVTDASNSEQIAFIPGKHSNYPDIIHRDYHDYAGYLYAVADEGFSSLQIIDLTQLPDTALVVYDSDSLIKNSHNIFIDTATAKLYACNVRTGEPRYAGLQVYSLNNPTQPELVYESNAFGVHDIFARNDTVFFNAENEGLKAYDFTNAANPTLLGTLDTYTDQGYNHSGWLSEDGKTYFLADETHGMRMKAINTTNIADMEEVAVFGSEVDVNSIAHNAIVHQGFLFVSYYHDGLRVFDINNLNAIEQVAFYDTYLAPDHQSYRGAWGVYPLLPSGKILVSDMQTGLYVFSMHPLFSVEELGNTTAQVYPNPSAGRVSFPNAEAQQLVYVIGMNGQSFSFALDASGSLNLPDYLSDGLYLIRWQEENLWHSQKLLLQR